MNSLKRLILGLIIAFTFIACSEKGNETSASKKETSLARIDSLENEIRIALEDKKTNPDIKLAMYAIQSYEFYSIDFPEDEKSGDYLFKAAQMYENVLRDPAKAIKVYQKVYDEYPNFDKQPMALFHIANAYHELKEIEKSVENFKLFMKNHPNHEFADDAEAMIKFVQMDETQMQEFFNNAGKSEVEEEIVG